MSKKKIKKLAKKLAEKSKKKTTHKLRAKDYFGVAAGSAMGGIVVWIGYFFYSHATWTSFIIGSVLSIPLGFYWQKGSTKCPSCKKDFQMSDTHTEVISEYQKFERRTVRKSGLEYKENVPVDITDYWQYQGCDNCGYERRSRAQSRKDA